MSDAEQATPTGSSDEGPELTNPEVEARIVRFAFGGERARWEAFVQGLRDAIPPDVTIILRGSAVTGYRWADEAPFDADGPGTSDLDLTLVGGAMLKLYRPLAMYIPALHSAPLDDRIPDAAPALVPLRRALNAIAGRPVNIQATTNLFQYARDVVMNQPYYTILRKEGREHELEAWKREIERRAREIEWEEYARERAAAQAANGAAATAARPLPDESRPRGGGR